MAFDITNVQHVSQLIEDTVGSVSLLRQTRDAIVKLQREVSVTGADAAIGAGGAVFPAAFNVTPGVLSNALGSLEVARAALATAINAGNQGNLDTLELNWGVRVGTG